MGSRGRILAEVGLSAYLLLIPAGTVLPSWPRDLALAAALAGLLLASLAAPADTPGPRFTFVVPLVLFAGSTALSTVLSAHPDRSLARGAYAPIAWMLFLVAQAVAATPAGYRRLLLVLGGVAAIVGVDGGIQLLTGRSMIGGIYPLEGRLTASLPHPNDLALVPVLLPLGLAGFAAGPPSPAGWLVLAGVPLAVVTVIGSASRNAWLGLVLGLAILAGLAYRATDAIRRRWIAGSAAAILVLLALGFGLSTAAVSDRARALLDPAREPRLVLWRVAVWMFRESPVVGQGVHTFRDFHGPVVESLALPPGVVRDREVVPWAHNLYLEILAERGLVGAMAFVAILTAMGVMLRRSMQESVGRSRLVAQALSASLATFLVLALFDLTFLKDWVLLVFWLLAALVARLPVLSAADHPIGGRSTG